MPASTIVRKEVSGYVRPTIKVPKVSKQEEDLRKDVLTFKEESTECLVY